MALPNWLKVAQPQLALGEGLFGGGGGGDSFETLGSFTARKRANLLQYLMLGGDINALKLGKGEKKGVSKQDKLKLGGSFFRVPGTDDLLAQSQKYQEQILGTKKQTAEALKQIPELSQLFAEAEGKGIDVADQAFQQLGQEVLGAAAPKGLLFDQAPGLLASVALEKAQFQRGIQERARGQTLGLLGFIGPQAYDPSNVVTPFGTQQSFGTVGQFDTLAAQTQNDALALQMGMNQSQQAGLGQLLGTLGTAAILA